MYRARIFLIKNLFANSTLFATCKTHDAVKHAFSSHVPIHTQTSPRVVKNIKLSDGTDRREWASPLNRIATHNVMSRETLYYAYRVIHLHYHGRFRFELAFFVCSNFDTIKSFWLTKKKLWFFNLSFKDSPMASQNIFIHKKILVFSPSEIVQRTF